MRDILIELISKISSIDHTSGNFRADIYTFVAAVWLADWKVEKNEKKEKKEKKKRGRRDAAV